VFFRDRGNAGSAPEPEERINVRKLLKVAIPLVLVPAALIGGSTAAHASITTGCTTFADGAQICEVQETMNSGYCVANVEQSAGGSSFAFENILDASGTGYDCSFWLERDVNGTGWYDESGQLIQSPGHGYNSQNYWDGSGYQARVCFEFLWSGTSDPGAVHCSGAIGDLGVISV
jgi:hypothetical protein